LQNAAIQQLILFFVPVGLQDVSLEMITFALQLIAGFHQQLSQFIKLALHLGLGSTAMRDSPCQL
jgi:hypothetical protein